MLIRAKIKTILNPPLNIKMYKERVSQSKIFPVELAVIDDDEKVLF